MKIFRKLLFFLRLDNPKNSKRIRFRLNCFFLLSLISIFFSLYYLAVNILIMKNFQRKETIITTSILIIFSFLSSLFAKKKPHLLGLLVTGLTTAFSALVIEETHRGTVNWNLHQKTLSNSLNLFFVVIIFMRWTNCSFYLFTVTMKVYLWMIDPQFLNGDSLEKLISCHYMSFEVFTLFYLSYAGLKEDSEFTAQILAKENQLSERETILKEFIQPAGIVVIDGEEIVFHYNFSRKILPLDESVNIGQIIDIISVLN